MCLIRCFTIKMPVGKNINTYLTPLNSISDQPLPHHRFIHPLIQYLPLFGHVQGFSQRLAQSNSPKFNCQTQLLSGAKACNTGYAGAVVTHNTQLTQCSLDSPELAAWASAPSQQPVLPL
jgi:hypothetical protein